MSDRPGPPAAVPRRWIAAAIATAQEVPALPWTRGRRPARG